MQHPALSLIVNMQVSDDLSVNENASRDRTTPAGCRNNPEKMPPCFRLLQHMRDILNVQHDAMIGKTPSDTLDSR